MSRKSFAVLLSLALGMAGLARAEETTKPSQFTGPSVAAVKASLADWLKDRQADEATKKKVEECWSKLPEQATELMVLSALVESFAAADAEAAKVAELCAKPKAQVIPPQQKWLADEKTPKFLANNLRLHFGRWLIHAELFDEAMDQIGSLGPKDVVAPATLLFYQSIGRHTMLDKKAGLESLADLLKQKDANPRRYTTLARLLEEDLKSLQDDTLDHVARRMNDVRRRLDNGQGGKKVRDKEDGIVETLDKIIKKEEDKQGGGGGGGGGSGQQDTIRSSSPAKDSMPLGGKGPGEVEKRNIGAGSDWGSLPPAEREKALQEVARDLPPHFRDVIEAYFRRIAAEPNE